MKSGTRYAAARWMMTVVGMCLLAAGCILSAIVLYGGNLRGHALQFQATSLSSVEVNELIGTTDYRTSTGRTYTNLLTALAELVRLPLADPYGMVVNQYPQVDTTLPTGNSSQSSLVQSLTQWQTQTNKIALGWVPYNTTSQTIAMIQQNPGMNVISPEWLQLWSPDGAIKNQTQSGVVAYCHSHHIQAWALLTNQFSGRLTHEVLSSSASRHRFIQNVVSAAVAGKLDGINVDFELVDSSDRALFSTFITELHQALLPQHITLSVDIAPDIVFLHDQDAFFHAQLADECDYVCLMAYDEHWGSDQTPGPVADVPWVTESVDDLLNTGVPADKLILGIPFYTRFWHVTSGGHVSSLNYKTSDVPGILAYHNATPTWNADLGVAYARYPKPDGYMEVWYETDRTLQQKLQLVNDTGLAGVAVWSLSWSDQHTWNTVMDALRQSVS